MLWPRDLEKPFAAQSWSYHQPRLFYCGLDISKHLKDILIPIHRMVEKHRSMFLTPKAIADIPDGLPAASGLLLTLRRHHVHSWGTIYESFSPATDFYHPPLTN